MSGNTSTTWRSLFNETKKAPYFLYLLARCVKAAIRYNASGQFNNTPDNRRKGARPVEMRHRITAAAALLGGNTKTTALHYAAVLAKCTPDDLIYMDPPYQGVSIARDHRYAPKVCHDEFAESLNDLNKKGCLFIVSYDGRTGGKRDSASHCQKTSA